MRGWNSRFEIPEPQLQETKSKWWTTTKLKKIRTGFLYEVRKDANHLSRRRLVSEFKNEPISN